MCCKTPLLVLVMLLVHDYYTLCITTSTSLPSNITDLHSLLAFKNAIEFDPHNVLATNWTTNTNFCNWYGVSCSKRRQRVTRLELLDMGLVGPISPHIGNLSFLSVLDLRNNNFHSQLTNDLGRLSRLTILVLYRNNITGKIPTSLSLCRKLQEILLSENHITGPLFENITTLPRLRFLFLGSNNLTGKIPVPLGNMSTLQIIALNDNKFYGTVLNEVARLSRLTGLYLGRNYLTGTIPLSLFNISLLEILALEHNSFSGDLPKDTGLQLPNLNKLVLGGNELTGSIPTHWYNMSRLTLLSMEYNYFTGILPPTLPTSLQILSLEMNNLQGEIPDFPNESPLSFVYLRNNNLTGSIPHSIVNLVNLTSLSLSSNKLNGTLEPLLFSKFERLDKLDLSHNFFQGSVPVLPVSLSTLLTSHNHLSGDIPSSICNTTDLQILDVSYNDFCGEIPQCLVKNNTLEVLDLQKNRFSGTIPPISADGLTTLNLNDNHLEGPIPESLSKCKKLELLDLGNNKLNGPFPHWLETFSELQVLVLKSNKFHGPVGTSRIKSPYPKLRIFDLSDNQFIGLLPTRYFQDFTAMKYSKETEGGPTYMERVEYLGGYKNSIAIVWNGVECTFERILTTLATIDLSANNFEGQIPEALQKLVSLRMLNLSHNSLTGPIPASLGNLFNLQILDLSSNILTGTIPIQLTSLTTLANLNVSYNHLVGCIPQGKQFNTFENNSYIENPGLCGLPLSNLCGDNKKPHSPIMIKQKEDQSIFSSGFTWKIVVFGYGCGVPFGLILGSLMFFVGWPRWFLGIAGPQNGRPRRRRNHM